MDSRRNNRTCASINLLIYKSGIPVGIGVTHDISNTGLFVQTDYVDVGPGNTLEFELLYSRKGLGERKRYRAEITERRSDGLALKFDVTCNRAAKKLVEMVEWVANVEGANRRRKKLNRLVVIPRISDSAR